MAFDPSTAQPIDDDDGGALDAWLVQHSPGAKASYRSGGAAHIVNAFKADDVAGVLKHSERVMPSAVRKGIKREWARARKASGEKQNLADFWAANSSKILAGRFTGRGSWRAQAKQWLGGLAEHVQKVSGLRNDSRVMSELRSTLTSKESK